MRSLHKITFIALSFAIILTMTNCEEVITEFGNDRSFSGTLKDEAGNIVPGDITTTNLSVKALGEGDVVSTDMRVNGAGVFGNKRLFPKRYKVFVTGPVTPVGDTIFIDLAKEKSITKDIIVVPFLTLSKPVLSGNPTASSITVNYSITANSGKSVAKRELYCSTNPYPNSSTGSGPFYSTTKVTLDSNSGTATVEGLQPKTTYYIRIGAQASGATGFNYSDQLEISTQ